MLGYLENKSATVFPATEGVAVTDEDAVADKDTTPVDDKTATSIVYRATTLTRRVAHGTVDLGKAKVTEVTTKAKALPIVASATAYAAPIVSSASSYVAPIVASTTNYASATVGSATAYVAPIVSSTKTLASTTFTSVTSYAAPVIASTKSYIATGTTLASTYTAPAITSARTYYASVTGNVTQRWTSARAHTTFFATKTQKTAAATYALASGAALNVAERLKDVTGAAGARWSTAKVTVPKALSSLTLADVKHTVLEQSAELYALAHVRLASQYARVQSLMSSVHVPEFVNTLLGRSGVVKLKTQ